MNQEDVKIVDLYSLVRFCFRKWRIWMMIGIICGMAGLIYVYMTEDGQDNNKSIDKDIFNDEELFQIDEYLEAYEAIKEVREEKAQMLQTLLKLSEDEIGAEYYERLEEYNIYTQFYNNAEWDIAQLQKNLTGDQQQYINQQMSNPEETSIVDREAESKAKLYQYIRKMVKYTVGFMLVGIMFSFFILMEVYLCNKRIKSIDEIENLFGRGEVIEAHRNIIFKTEKARLTQVASAYLKNILSDNAEVNIINLGERCKIKEFQEIIEKSNDYTESLEKDILFVEAGVSRYEDVKIIEKQKSGKIKAIIYIC